MIKAPGLAQSLYGTFGSRRFLPFLCALVVSSPGMLAMQPAHADETCNSPYISNLIKGQEDFVHVWTLGVKDVGDGSDKLVTVDVNPASKQYG